MEKRNAAAIILLCAISLALWWCWNEPVRLTYSGLEKLEGRNYEGAVSDFDAAINFQPSINQGNFAAAYFGRGYTKLKMMDLNGALPDLRIASQLEPSSARAWKTLGYVEYKLGMHEEGRNDIRKALLIEWPTISPDDPSIDMNVQGEIERLDYSMN